MGTSLQEISGQVFHGGFGQAGLLGLVGSPRGIAEGSSLLLVTGTHKRL